MRFSAPTLFSVTGRWRSRTFSIMCSLSAKPLQVPTIPDLLLLKVSFPFYRARLATPGRHCRWCVSDVIFAVCHNHGREVIHEMTCGEAVRAMCCRKLYTTTHKSISQRAPCEDSAGGLHALPPSSLPGGCAHRSTLASKNRTSAWRIVLQCQSEEFVQTHCREKNLQVHQADRGLSVECGNLLVETSQQGTLERTTPLHCVGSPSTVGVIPKSCFLLVSSHQDRIQSSSARDRPFARSIWIALQGHNDDAGLGGERKRLFNIRQATQCFFWQAQADERHLTAADEVDELPHFYQVLARLSLHIRHVNHDELSLLVSPTVHSSRTESAVQRPLFPCFVRQAPHGFVLLLLGCCCNAAETSLSDISMLLAGRW